MSASPQANHYGVIYADPPWTFSTYSRKGKGRSAEAYYDCMSLEEIKAVPVGEWAAKDCVLLLWTTDPLLERALEVIRAWGFTYKTIGFYWAKLKRSVPLNLYNDESFFTGLGFWTRANPEPCLLATRGNPHRRNANVQKLIVSPRREHSRKPDEVYERIEALCEGPYLEVFARNSRDGWLNLGVEVDAFDGGRVPTRRWASTGYPDTTAPRREDQNNRGVDAGSYLMNTLPVIEGIRASGIRSYSAIAKALNERQIPTTRSGVWHAATVRNLLKKAQSE